MLLVEGYSAVYEVPLLSLLQATKSPRAPLSRLRSSRSGARANKGRMGKVLPYVERG
jgi:hypothetical protein